jgi:hypothetical protein
MTWQSRRRNTGKHRANHVLPTSLILINGNSCSVRMVENNGDMLVDDTKNTQSTTVLTAKIDEGLLIVSRKLVSSQEYAAGNMANKDKTLIIERPRRSAWTLVDTPRSFATTPDLYHFKGIAVANKVTVFTVKEELVTNETSARTPNAWRRSPPSRTGFAGT